MADELEEAYRSHIWDPSLRHVKKQKQGVTAARVELTSLFTKVSPIVYLAPSMHNMVNFVLPILSTGVTRLLYVCEAPVHLDCSCVC